MHFVVGLVVAIMIIALILGLLGVAFAQVSVIFGHPVLLVLAMTMAAVSAGMIMSLYQTRHDRVMSDNARMGPENWRVRPETAATVWMSSLTLVLLAVGRFFSP